MRLATVILLIICIAAPVFAAVTAPSEKDITIVHFSKLREGKLEGNATDLKFLPVIGTPAQTPFIRLENELLTPRTVTVQILDLTEPLYDVYIFDTKNHGNIKPLDPNTPPRPVYLDPKLYYIGKKTKSEIESGLSVTFPGTQLSPDYSEYISQVRARCLAKVSTYEGLNDNDAQICVTSMKTTPEWVDKLIEADARMRIMSIALVPAGKPVILAGGGVLAPPADFNASVKNFGDNLQFVRYSLVKHVKNQFYLYDVLDALAPMNMKLTTAAPIKPGRVVVRVLITNWMDRPVTGTLKLNLPKGWSAVKLTAPVKLKPFARDAEVRLAVKAPAKASAETISATASLVVDNIKLKLQAKN